MIAIAFVFVILAICCFIMYLAIPEFDPEGSGPTAKNVIGLIVFALLTVAGLIFYYFK